MTKHFQALKNCTATRDASRLQEWHTARPENFYFCRQTNEQKATQSHCYWHLIYDQSKCNLTSKVGLFIKKNCCHMNNAYLFKLKCVTWTAQVRGTLLVQ